MIKAEVKPYVGREVTPDFFENFKSALRKVVEGVPQNQLQGKTKQLTLNEVLNWEDTKEDLKEDFSNWLVEKTTEQIGKKYPKALTEGLKGEEKIKNTLEQNAEIQETEAVKKTEKTLEETPEGYRDEAFRGGQKRAETIGELPEEVKTSHEDLVGQIEEMRKDVEKPRVRYVVRPSAWENMGLTKDQARRYNVIGSKEKLDRLKREVERS